MEKFSTTSKFVSAGAVMVLGLGISAAVLTSSANADETHSLPKISHISKSDSSIPAAVLPSTIQAPSIASMPKGGESEDDAISSTSDDESSDD
ncbi:MAG TPA: hypothetical protein VGJ85_05150 [Candidatus Nanopelagicaceae bacterium]